MFLTHYVQYIRPIIRTYRLKCRIIGCGRLLKIFVQRLAQVVPQKEVTIHRTVFFSSALKMYIIYVLCLMILSTFQKMYTNQ